MSRVHIITDSTAHFPDPTLPDRLGVTVVPQSIQFGRQTYREGVDITGKFAAVTHAARCTRLKRTPSVNSREIPRNSRFSPSHFSKMSETMPTRGSTPARFWVGKDRDRLLTVDRLG
jgi:hypothetical protein